MKLSKISYFLFPTALGNCAIAFSERGGGEDWRGLLGLTLPGHTEGTTVKALARAARQALPKADRDLPLLLADEPPPQVLEAARAIRDFLSGELSKESTNLDGILLDMAHISPFRTRVFQATRAIPRGEVRTYGELAQTSGSRAAARAVGQAMAQNPWPLIVPCHRVLSGAGALHGFSAPGGTKTKARLLALESAPTSDTKSTSSRQTFLFDAESLE